VALSKVCYEVTIGWDDTSSYSCLLKCELLDVLVVTIDCHLTSILF
jgi:hypothetical protein